MRSGFCQTDRRRVSIQVRILGPLEVWDDGRVVELGAGRQRALLALLVLHARETVATDSLIEELWGSSPPPTAPKALQNLVSQLRRSLGPAAIETVSGGYCLPLADGDLDARQFEHLAAQGHRVLEDDPERAAQIIRDGLGLWRGRALADFAYDDFAQSEIARLDELRLGAIEDRIDADLATSGATTLVPELEQLVSAHPLRERLRGQLMLALYRSGRQAEALEVFRDGRVALTEELGLEPGVALRQLEQAILTQDPALGAPAKLPRPAGNGHRHRLILAAAGIVVLLAGFLAVALATGGGGGGAAAPVPNSLVKIDAETNEIVAAIPVGRSPGEVAVVGDYVVVSSEEDATLTRVDVASGETTTSGASGADMGLAAMGDRFVWAVSLQQDRLTRVDITRLQSIDGVALAADLGFVFVAVGGGSLWVTQYAPAAVLRYDLRTLQLRRRYDLGPTDVPVDLAYGYGAAWVVLGDSRALLRVDARTGRAETIPAGALPSGPAVGFGSIWSSSIAEGTMWRFDGVTGERTSPVVDVGPAPFGVATGAGSVWIANNCDGIVSRMDPETGEVVATVETGYFPKWLAVGRGYVWVGLAAEAWDSTLCN
jgi:DNA-binding SARP family transcriptional activator/DNA-binding beta-propeller fold protein YncE